MDALSKTEERVCGFCKGEPVADAATWLAGKPRPPAPCPRCGAVPVDSPILRDRAEDDGEPPKALRVVDFTPQGHATPRFGIVADYGWAERILFADAYERDARDIARALGDRLGIEVTG